MRGILDWVEEQVTNSIKWKRLNGWLVIFWTFMFPVSIILGLTSIVAFISILSLYANWATHLGVWAGARAEAKQVEIAETQEVNVNNAENVNLND